MTAPVWQHRVDIGAMPCTFGVESWIGEIMPTVQVNRFNRLTTRVILFGCPIDYPTLLTGLHWAPIGSARCALSCLESLFMPKMGP